VTAKTVVFSSAATTSAWVVVVVTTGAAMAPVVKAAQAAIIAIVVFMFSLVARMLNYPSSDRTKPHLFGVPRFFLAIRNNA
jgi:O-antigen ligase